MNTPMKRIDSHTTEGGEPVSLETVFHPAGSQDIPRHLFRPFRQQGTQPRSGTIWARMCIASLAIFLGSMQIPILAENNEAISGSSLVHGDRMVRTAGQPVQGIFLFPDGTVNVIGTLHDHNVVSIANGAGAGDYIITLNGQTGTYTGVISIAYRGGAGGFDTMTQTSSDFMSAIFFHGNNQITLSDNSHMNLTLFGDNNVVDTTAGFVDVTEYGGPNNQILPVANASVLLNSSFYSESAIQGIFTYGQFVQSIMVVSSVVQSDLLVYSFDSNTNILTVNEGGQIATFSEATEPISQVEFEGSWGGGDIVDNQSPFGIQAFFYGNGDQFTAHSPSGANLIYLSGNDDQVTSNGVLGDVFVWGSNETISGFTVTTNGGAPTTGAPPPAGTSGTSTGTGSSTATTSASTTGTGSSTGNASSTATATSGNTGSNPVASPSSDSSGHGCGIGSIGGILCLGLSWWRRRQRTNPLSMTEPTASNP
jgi:hypothetical protein